MHARPNATVANFLAASPYLILSRTPCTGSRPRFTIHPAQLAHGEGRHNQSATQAVLQPAQPQAGLGAFTPDEEGLAKELNVKREEVSEMETRLSGGDIALEGQVEDGEEAFAPIAYLADSHSEPTAGSPRVSATSCKATVSPARSNRWMHAAAALSRRASCMSKMTARWFDASRPRRRIRRVGRADSPDRSQRHEEDAQRIERVRVTHTRHARHHAVPCQTLALPS